MKISADRSIRASDRARGNHFWMRTLQRLDHTWGQSHAAWHPKHEIIELQSVIFFSCRPTLGIKSIGSQSSLVHYSFVCMNGYFSFFSVDLINLKQAFISLSSVVSKKKGDRWSESMLAWVFFEIVWHVLKNCDIQYIEIKCHMYEKCAASQSPFLFPLFNSYHKGHR